MITRKKKLRSPKLNLTVLDSANQYKPIKGKRSIITASTLSLRTEYTTANNADPDQTAPKEQSDQRVCNVCQYF